MNDTRPRCVLSIDGGGVRGISAILQLGLIMKTVNRKLKRPRGQHLLPWQVFSLIGGTSTGGILAVMLGRLKMSTDECLDEYCKLSKIVFQPKRARADIPRRAADRLTADERFDADVLEQQIRAVIEKKIGDADIPLMDDEGEISPCRVFVCSKMSSVGHVSLLRSYENENQPDSISDRCKLWEACRATSAASTFFSPCKIAGRVFIDGALGMNNPVEAVWQEAKDLWGDGNTVIISLGTGEKPSTTTHEGLTGIVKTLEEIATETQNTANRFIQRNNDLVERDFYYRFNVPGLGRVGLHEYQRVELLEEQTDGYLNRHEISQRLLRCAEKLREVCQSPLFDILDIPIYKLNDIERSCLASLYNASPDYDYQLSSIDSPVTETCDWLTDNSSFRSWLAQDSAHLLWLTGHAGQGKTVLAKHAANALPRLASGAIVCSFFFKDGEASRMEAHQALSSMLYRIYSKLPREIHTSRRYFDFKGDAVTKSVEQLWQLITLVPSRIILILDGLDGCAQATRDRLLHQIASTFELPTNTKSASLRANLKVLITSRPDAVIERRLSRIRHSIHRVQCPDQGPLLKLNIERVIYANVKQLEIDGTLAWKAARFLECELVKSAGQTYLWLALMFKKIANMKRRSIDNIKIALQSPVDGLDTLYENSFRETDNYKDSRALLQIVLTATSPMSLHQINVAMGINAKTSSIEGLLECLEPNMEETVTGLGRIFIAIRNDKVELIHQTARQFLLRTEASQNGQGSWRHSIDLLESNLLLAEKCVACLLMQDWVRLTKSSAIPYRPTTQTSKDAMNWQVTTSNLEIDDNPLVAWRETFDWSTKEPIKSFCTYAAKNWFHHLQVFGPSFSDQGDLVNLREQARRLCDLRQRYFGVWWSIYANINKDTRIESYMHFLAQRGDFAIMQGLVDSNSCSVFLDEDKRAFDDRGSEDENLQKRGNDLLITATKYEQKSAVEWLLQQDSDGFLEMGTALLVAIDNHMDPIVQILVDEVADLNEAHRDLASVEGRYEEDEFSKSTPLEVALRSNNLSAMNLLLENGAEFQQVDSCGYTPWAQVIFGDELKYFKGNTAVTAIKKGKESRRSEPASSTAMVEAMISHGVHPNAADYLNRTPLHYAAIAGDSDIIRTLLAAGASSDIQAKVDEESNVLRTPYRMAKALGHKEQAALLKIASPTTTTPEEYEGNYTLSSSPPPSTGLKRQASGPAGWHESRRPRSGGFDPRELGVRHGALPFREKHVVSTLRRS